jgi:hypothetical protein
VILACLSVPQRARGPDQRPKAAVMAERVLPSQRGSPARRGLVGEKENERDEYSRRLAEKVKAQAQELREQVYNSSPGTTRRIQTRVLYINRVDPELTYRSLCPYRTTHAQAEDLEHLVHYKTLCEERIRALDPGITLPLQVAPFRKTLTSCRR